MPDCSFRSKQYRLDAIEFHPSLASQSGKFCEKQDESDMAPSSSQEPPQVPLRNCALAPHRLKTPSRKITDPYLVNFAKRINSEIRVGNLLCLNCYQNLKNLYRMKMANARQHHEKRKREESSGNSISDVSNSQRMVSTSSSSDEVSVPGNRPTASPLSSRDSSPTTSAAAAAKRQRTSAPPPPSSRDSSPTTSAAAAAKRQRTSSPPPPIPAALGNSSYVSDDDDPNSNLSLNAVNGTRLPHIQPIPKRRQFVHLNKNAMDIYLAGTTGG